jgi:predicted site-specific integrase-resolvase
MKKYSISDVARILEVDRKTLHRWINEKLIPAPKPGVVNGRLAKVWTHEELMDVKRYMGDFYWGKGLDRRKGKRSKQVKN